MKRPFAGYCEIGIRDPLWRGLKSPLRLYLFVELDIFTYRFDATRLNPPLALRTGRTIACVQAVEKIDGLDWQRWSRHRTGSCVWKPGVDNLESHFAYVQDWLVREIGQ